MPVEETGNMLILTAALAEMEGNAKFAEKYWPTLTKWAVFLREKGFDPENQLSTDDFMGHMAHQTNLSVKAILGLASYGKLCEIRGLSAQALEYKILAQGFAKQWAKEALDGDHYRLAFDQPGTWGQKYNMVWDRILGLDIFPKALKQTEMAFYRKKLSPLGLALDSRQNAHPSKIDWTLWTATLTENDADFQAMVDATFRYVNESPQRNGIGDLYDCFSGKHIGMHSRPVVGGFFLKMLYDKKLWQKYAKMDETNSADWAPLPERPVYDVIVPTSEKTAQTWSYRTEKPEGKWFEVGYDASAWKQGPGGFGSRETPGVVVGTVWNSPDIWLRREFTVTGSTANLLLSLYHDEDAEVYINGVLVARETGYNNNYDLVSLAKSAVKVGKNVIAVHCHQTTGGQGIDVGIVRLKVK